MKRIAPVAGLLTCVTLYSVIIIAALAYNGQQRETYSIFNHFISELGSPKFSHHYLLYNVGLIISAICLGVFTVGWLAYANTRMSRMSVRLGVLASILCVGVGLVPEDYRVPHLILALGFFSMASCAVTMFSWSILKEQQNPFPRYTAIHGFIVPIVFALFMSMPKDLLLLKREMGHLFARPDVWYLPFFEWMVFLAMTSWITIVSIKMLHLQQNTLEITS